MSVYSVAAMFHHTYADGMLRRALLVAVLLGGWSGFAGAQEAAQPSLPDRMQMDAYLALFRGDEARDEGQLEQAAQAYGEAADAYRALQSSHPDHQPSMVTYRLAHAERELASIEVEQPVAPPIEVDGELFEREQINALRTENRYLRQKLLTLEDELERGEEPAPQFVEELQQLSRKNQDLSLTVTSLRKQLEVSNVDRTELRAAQQEARELNTVVAQQRSQLSDQRRRSEELGSLREQVSELKSRNRQLELAIKGAEQEANTIRRLEEQLRVQNTKGQMLLDERNRLVDDVKAMKVREETLQTRRQQLEASQAEAEKALAASLKEAQGFMDRGALLDEAVARAEASVEQLQGELAAAKEGQEEAAADLVEVESELQALRKMHIEAEAKAAQMGQVALEARNLETEISEMEQAHRTELTSVRQAQAEAVAARAREDEQERAALVQEHVAALEEAVRRGEERVAEEGARHATVVSNLMAKHAADLEELKFAMQALKDDLKLALNAPVPISLDPIDQPVPMKLPDAERAAEEASATIVMLQQELDAAREAVDEARAERDVLAENAADADELRRTIATLTEEQARLQNTLDAGD